MDAPPPMPGFPAQGEPYKEYAARFWMKNSGTEQETRREMQRVIEAGAARGFLALNAPDKIVGDVREKVSAYWDLAWRLGYEVGQFRKTDERSGTAMAPIKKRPEVGK
jgi:hypothetical protein